MTTKEENIPLAALNEIFLKLNRQIRMMQVLAYLSVPAVAFAVAFSIILTILWAVSFSPLNALVYGFLVFSAVSMILGVIVIPSTLTEAIRKMEITAQNISMAIMPPKGTKPEEIILNQLLRSDFYIRNVVKTKKGSVSLGREIEAKSGKKYFFDVYIRNRVPFGILRPYGDMDVFVKRFDQNVPVSEQLVKNTKQEVADILMKEKRRVPSRVLLVSTSGFEDSVFEYVKSKAGIFQSRLHSETCMIDLVREKVNGYFEVLN